MSPQGRPEGECRSARLEGGQVSGSAGAACAVYA